MVTPSVVPDISYETFFGEFDGVMKTFVFRDGRRIVLEKPIPIVKGKAYVLKYNRKTGQCSFLPVILPKGRLL